MVEAGRWEAAPAPIRRSWNNNPPNDFPNYAAGTWGTEAALRINVSESLVFLGQACSGRLKVPPGLLKNECVRFYDKLSVA